MYTCNYCATNAILIKMLIEIWKEQNIRNIIFKDWIFSFLHQIIQLKKMKNFIQYSRIVF